MRVIICARLTALFLALSAFIALEPSPHAANSDIETVYQKILQLDAAGQHEEALSQARLLEKLAGARYGQNHASYAYALGVEAWMLDAAGQTDAADDLYQRALKLFGKTEGARSAHIPQFLLRLGKMYLRVGRLPAAEQAFRLTVAIYEKHRPGDALVGDALLELAVTLETQGRLHEAEAILLRAKDIYAKAYGPESTQVNDALSELAIIRKQQGRFAEAEDLHLQLLKVLEKESGSDSRLTMELGNLAGLYAGQGRFAEAEALLRRALALTEASPTPADQQHIIVNLANVLAEEGRLDEAARLEESILQTDEQALGPDHPTVLAELHNLAVTYQDLGRLDKAAALFRRALASKEKQFGPADPALSRTLEGIANVLSLQGDYEQAVSIIRRALAINEKALGPEHPDTANNLYNLGVYQKQNGHPEEAEAAYQRALFIRKATLPPISTKIADTYNNLGNLYASLNRWEEALVQFREASKVLVERLRRGESELQDRVAAQPRRLHSNLVLAASHVAEASPEQFGKLADEAFVASQRAEQSSAAIALSQMAARFAVGDSDLANAIRKQQDLASEAKRLDVALIAAISKPAAERNADDEQVLRKQAEDISKEIAELNASIARSFPDYAALTTSEPLSIADAQQLLSEDEALMVYLVGPTGSFVWAITRKTVAWHRLTAHDSDLAAKIGDLRHLLGVGDGARGLSRADTASAPKELQGLHELYEDLLGPVESALKGKNELLVVASGALTSIPFHMLITSAPTSSDYAKAAWLLRTYAITTLPAVSTLKALRVLDRKGQAPKLLIGYGNPKFGDPESGDPSRQVADTRRAVEPFMTYFRGAHGDRDRLAAALPALPGTAVELNAVAHNLGIDKSDIHLGRDASEAAVKSAKLDDYDIIYFATHGLVAGETEQVAGLSEPALALSIPDQMTDLDDGLLTASEAAQLKLRADWVVLSACNTAAGDKPGAEALSGLARAFFYAGARALMVSHWPVDDQAAARLTSDTFARLKKDPSLRRSQALRQSMLALIDDPSSPANAQPAIWAPFVIVGDGGPIER